ncbi:MAG TPA: pitrilysin family protein [Solirubrobacterales bacterium]|nr:pitrilysin family protein [Solirubrobacterales bacterium]
MALPEGVELTELDGGLRVVTERVPAVRSVALGLWVRTGSRDETPAQAGVSHFLEHLLFKGTERYSAIEISEYFDGLGAATNAATSKETTQLYSRFLDEHTERALDLLAEMFLAPTFPDIDSERQVVIEEIAMYEDEPSDRVHDVLADAIYGDAPLGRRILGTAEVIGSIPVPDIAAYHQSRYVSSNIVVSASGSLEHERLVELAAEHLQPRRGEAGASNGAAAATTGRLCFYPKETEQYHVCLGAPGISRGDERRWALNVLDTILGGSSSSRLFREVREKRGLAYSVGSYSSQFADQGTVAMYVGTREDNVAEACEVIAAELESLRSTPVEPAELERAKEHVKGRTVLVLESTSARMSRNAAAILFDLPLLDIDELIAKIDAVTIDDVAALAAELYSPERISAACIGADEGCFREAVTPISPALAA